MFGKRRVYLDWASAAPVLKEAERAFGSAMAAYGNPESAHEEGRAARKILESARIEIARLLEVKPDDVVFTSGATEANNLAIRGLVRPGSHMLYHPGAHASLVEAVKMLEGVIVETLPLKEGRVDTESLKKMIRPTTVLIAMEAVCGETGTLWNTREVAHVLHESKTVGPAYLLVDASQAPLTQKITRSHFDADLMVLDAQKVGGVRGIGVVVAPRTIPLAPLIVGGGQERGVRAGTPSPALAAAFAAALAVVVKNREVFALRAAAARKALVERITHDLSGVYINEGREVAPHVLNLSLPGRDTDYLVALLDAAGFAVSTRSACETDSTEGSRAVFALTGDAERSLATIRISWGPLTSPASLMQCAATLAKEIEFVDKHAPKSHY